MKVDNAYKQKVQNNLELNNSFMKYFTTITVSNIGQRKTFPFKLMSIVCFVAYWNSKVT